MLNDWIRLLDDSDSAPKPIRPIEQGEVARYGRRSVKGEGGLAGKKSVADQEAETADISDEHGLPTSPSDYYAEPPGYSGKTFYDGGTGRHAIHEELKFDEKRRRRVRPRLTALVQDIESRRKRVVVAWSLCRLWRSVRLCEHLLDLFEEFDVELYDKDGKVDYRSPKGRADVVGAAVRFETQRKEIKQGVERGLRRNRKRKKIASNPNCLGIRTKGTRTNAVRFLDDELYWVERMMRLYVGDGASRPLSTIEIGDAIVREGMRWPEDLRRSYEGLETCPTDRVTCVMVQHVLTNVRYVGYHPTLKGAYQCSAFLRDGKPLIPIDLFLRVQRRLKQERRLGCRTRRPDRALTSLLLCGLDASPLQCQTAVGQLTGGNTERYEVWRPVPRVGTGCDHCLPNIRDEVLMTYIAEQLGPLISAELEGRLSGSTDTQRLEQLNQQLMATEEEITKVDELALTTWREDPTFAYRLAQQLKARRRTIQAEILRCESSHVVAADLIPHGRDLQSADPATRADAVRALIRWIAIIPSGKPRVRSEGSREWTRNPDQGRLFFCLELGVYHTAAITFDASHPRGYHKRINLLRPAEPHECLEGVNDLPEPAKFIDGLRTSRLRHGIDFDFAVDAPGYVTEATQREMA